jgi:hypothetical protein
MFMPRVIPISTTIAAVAMTVLVAIAAPVIGTTMSIADGEGSSQTPPPPPPPPPTDGHPWDG